MKPKLDLISTDPKVIMENFRRIERAWLNEPMMKGDWKFFEITISKATAHFKQKHFLNFQPKDVIQTSLTGTGTLTWNNALFDGDWLDITTTGPCVVRAFVGRHEEGDI